MSFYLNSCLLFCFILFFCSYKGKAQALELEDVLKISLENSSLAVQLQKNVLIKDLEYSKILFSSRPTLSLQLSGPSYTHTLSPVEQPDGTIDYKSINRTNYSTTANLSYPLLFSGGSLSVSSSLSSYMNLGSNGYNNYSFNYYSAAISQPLNFFSSTKWERIVGKWEDQIKGINLCMNYVYIKKTAAELYFKLLKTNIQIKNTEEKINYLQEYLKIVEQLYQKEKISRIDYIEFKLMVSGLKNSLNDTENLYQISKSELTTFLKVEDLIIDTNEIPFLVTIFFDESIAFLCLNKIQSIKEECLYYSNKQREKYFKAQKGLNSTLNISFGLNSSGMDWEYIGQQKQVSESFSFSINIPILDWGYRRADFLISQLTNTKKFEEFEYSSAKEIIDLESLFFQLKENEKSYYNLVSHIELLKEKNEILFNKMQHGAISIKELRDNEYEILDSEYKLITLIEKSWECYFNIEKMTLYDFISDNPIADYLRDF